MNSIRVSDSIGSVSCELIKPRTPKAVMSFAHGAGAGMNHPFMKRVATGLAEKDIATLRFNFPFMENKKGRPDPPAIAHKTIAAAAAALQKNFKDVPLFAAGKSFGGRMSSQWMATAPDMEISGLVFFGFPLHAAGKPSIDRGEHLKQVKCPMLFLQGTRDALAVWELIDQVCTQLPNATLVKVEGADHSFKAGSRDVLAELIEDTDKWISGII